MAMFGCMVPAFTLMFCINANGSMYAYALLPEYLKDQTIVFIAFAFIETILVSWNLAYVGVYFVSWCPSIFQNIIWLDDLVE